MKDGIVLDGICCAYCLHEEGCKISEHLTNSRHVAFCSNYEKNADILSTKNFNEYPKFTEVLR